MNNKYLITLSMSVFLLLNCCIDDNVAPPLTGDLVPAAELLVYFEEQGDFANSPDAPALIDADEVYANLNSFLIIDIRNTMEFNKGHIENSINVTSDSLYNYFRSFNSSLYEKIILVSKSGQSSAYFTCLLRLKGISNVYSLKFGLASWNVFFADEWLAAIGEDPYVSSYTNEPIPKNEFTDLPEIPIENPDASLEEIADARIKKIMNEGFIEKINFETRITNLEENYLICYGKSRLYSAPRSGPLPELGHNSRTVLYISDPLYELRSVNYLQTLPTDRKILLYDETGQLGACIAAYLRVLGYNAVTLLFGANHLIYARIIGDPEISEYAFDNSDIKNYPYVIN